MISLNDLELIDVQVASKPAPRLAGAGKLDLYKVERRRPPEGEYVCFRPGSQPSLHLYRHDRENQHYLFANGKLAASICRDFDDGCPLQPHFLLPYLTETDRVGVWPVRVTLDFDGGYSGYTASALDLVRQGRWMRVAYNQPSFRYYSRRVEDDVKGWPDPAESWQRVGLDLPALINLAFGKSVVKGADHPVVRRIYEERGMTPPTNQPTTAEA